MDEILERQKKELEEIIQRLRERIQKIRTGRATPGLVEDLIVDYYGTKVKLKQIAAISCPEPREILIQVWDKNAVEAIEKALIKADLGTLPIVEKDHIRIKLPPLTEEFRRNLIAKIGQEKEEAREAVRRLRDKIIKKITSGFEEGEISEDEKFRLKEKVQEMVDEYNQKIEEIIQQKTKEIMES